MEETRVEFSELITTARTAGFDVTDGNGLPITEEALSSVEDENLAGEQVHLQFREPLHDQERAIIADVHVRDQVYHLVGDVRNIEELRTRIAGITRPQDAPWD